MFVSVVAVVSVYMCVLSHSFFMLFRLCICSVCSSCCVWPGFLCWCFFLSFAFVCPVAAMLLSGFVGAGLFFAPVFLSVGVSSVVVVVVF